MKRTSGIVGAVLAVTTLTAGAFALRRGDGAPALATQPVSRGAIVNVIAATGTLEAVTTVEVGSQISGTVESLGADFNSIVRRGQVVARLDPSLYRTQVDQARANVAQAQAEVDRSGVALADATAKLDRARVLAARQLIAATDLQDAEVAERTADAQVRSSRAQVTQARAQLSQAEVNLEKTVIASPIDGIVINRSVDVGQTVSASLQAPTLFQIAADLSQMQLSASIDEADVGRIQQGQVVTFSVDAYPGATFTGAVEQVRLNPVVVSNVVTYAAIVSAPNPDLRLKPGMTANLTIEVARRDDVVRVPNAALRFKPTAEALKALDAAALPVDPNAAAGSGVVWLPVGDSMRAMPVTLGASDDLNTEVIDTPLTEGTRLVTRVTLGSVTAPTTTVTSSPLMPGAPGRR